MFVYSADPFRQFLPQAHHPLKQQGAVLPYGFKHYLYAFIETNMILKFPAHPPIGFHYHATGRRSTIDRFYQRWQN